MNAGQLWNDHTFRVLLEDLFKARKDEALGPLRLEAIFRYVEGTQPAPVQEYRTQSVPKDLRKPMQEGGVFPVAILPGKDRAQVSGPTVIPGREPVDGPGGAFELSEPEEDLPPGFILEQEDGPRERMSFCYKCNAGRKVTRRGKVWRCETCNSSNVNSEPSAADGNLGAYADGEAAHRSSPMEALNRTADLIEKNLKEGRTTFTIPKHYLTQGIEGLLKERRISYSSFSCVLMPKQVHLNTASPSAISGEAGTTTGGWTITITR